MDLSDHVGAKSPIFDIFSFVAPQLTCVKTVRDKPNMEGIHCLNCSCKNDWWEATLLPEILSQSDHDGAKFEKYAAITPKRYEIGCQLLLITNRKSHTGLRLVPTSMTLNDLERRNSPYFAFFHEIRQIFRPIISQWLKIDL